MTAWTDERRTHALAAIGEGFCPQQHGPLTAGAAGTAFIISAGESLHPGGWCAACRTWWRTHAGEVAANYPVTVSWREVVML